jgi:hypothetical protein
MRFAFETRWLRFELEIGTPVLRPRKYVVLPRKTCFRVQENLRRGIAVRLHERAISPQ